MRVKWQRALSLDSGRWGNSISAPCGHRYRSADSAIGWVCSLFCLSRRSLELEGERSRLPTPAMPLPVFSNILEVSELRICGPACAYRGETELLKAIGRGRARSGDTVHRLGLTLRKMVRLGDKSCVLGVFESGGFSSFSPEPLIVVLFTPDYDVVTWKAFEASTSMRSGVCSLSEGAVQVCRRSLFWCISMGDP